MALMVEKEYVPTYVIHYLGVRIFFLDLHRNAQHLPILYWTHTAK